MGRALDSLDGLELARARVHQDGDAFRYWDNQTGAKRIHAFYHAANLFDFDQQYVVGNWVGDHTSDFGPGQSQHSDPGHDAQLGYLLPCYSVGTLVVDPDAGDLVAFHVYRPLLALGEHQRIS